jgi:CheY-like chemotaxis protein
MDEKNKATETKAVSSLINNSSSFFKHKKKILVVDDTAVIRKQIARALGAKGFECISVEDGKEAVDKAKEAFQQHNPFMLIFMDLQMPIMNGQTATLAIRKFDNKVPIICMSTLVNNADELAEYTVAMNGYLSKQPFKKADLDLIVDPYRDIRAATPCLDSKRLDATFNRVDLAKLEIGTEASMNISPSPPASVYDSPLASPSAENLSMTISPSNNLAPSINMENIAYAKR